MAKTNMGVPTSAPKKSKKKWIIGGVVSALLIAAIVLGAGSNMFGAFRLTSFEENTVLQPNLEISDVELNENSGGFDVYIENNGGAKSNGAFCIKYYATYMLEDSDNYQDVELESCFTDWSMTNIPANSETSLRPAAFNVHEICVDSKNNIEEGNENDNCYEFQWN